MSKFKKILIALCMVFVIAVPAIAILAPTKTIPLPEETPPVVVPDTPSGDTDITLTYSRTFGENSPAVIAQVSNIISSENLSVEVIYDTYGWSIGDEIEITMKDGQIVDHRIIGFNHDTITGTNTKAGICLQPVNCFKTTAVMNTTNTNAGGWEASLMRTETAVSTLANYPDEWQAQIKAVDKKSANGGSTNYTETVTTSDKLFLLSRIEVFNETTAQDGANEGVQYAWYAEHNTDAERIKYFDSNSDGVIDSSDSAVNWWLRSCYSGNTNLFCYVYSSGYSASSGAIYSYGVAFGFNL